MNINKLIISLLEKNPYSIIICIILSFACMIIFFFIGRIIQKHSDKLNIQNERADAIKRSRAVIGGQFGEQISPFLPDFPCNPGDVKFIGKPVDYIAFPGSAQGKPVEEILLIEVKSGESQLSLREKEIKKAVECGRVKYVEYKLPF